MAVKVVQLIVRSFGIVERWLCYHLAVLWLKIGTITMGCPINRKNMLANTKTIVKYDLYRAALFHNYCGTRECWFIIFICCETAKKLNVRSESK
jgi:hypothetical protein